MRFGMSEQHIVGLLGNPDSIVPLPRPQVPLSDEVTEIDGQMKCDDPLIPSLLLTLLDAKVTQIIANTPNEQRLRFEWREQDDDRS